LGDTIFKVFADLLNNRGFVIDEDVSSFYTKEDKYSDLAGWANSNLPKIRKYGYIGGPLSDWSTKFNAFGCAYGVINSNKTISYSYIENYLKVSENISLCDSMTIEDFKSYGLGLLFSCLCGHSDNVKPDSISTTKNKLVLNDVTGKCTKCGKKSSPVDAFKPWEN
jgi:hypothetical protein